MKNSTRTIRSIICSPLVAMATLAAAVHTARAQEQASAPAGESSTARGGLQEVVVTATRREEALSKVPISVTALTQEALDQKGIKDMRDIVRFTPGVTIDDSGTNAISIRGISSSGGAGTTGIYIDDTPIQMRSVGFNPDDTLPKAFDLQRVEVLRGPQGTLFGAGAEGGAVRYIMTPASTTAADTYVRSDLSYTQYGQPNAEFGIAVGHPVVEGVFGIRGSIWYRYDGGWMNRDHQPQHQLFALLHGAPGGHVAAEPERHRYAQHPFPEAGQARRVHLLAGVFEPESGAIQHRDSGAGRWSGYLLPAGAQDGLEPRQEPADR